MTEHEKYQEHIRHTHNAFCMVVIRHAAKRKELDAAEKRIAELSAIFKRLYEDSVTGRISDERFAELSADYEAEQKQVKTRAAELQAELAKAQEATVNAEKFMNVVRKYTSFEELTHTLPARVY